jgi:hypothetical protein
MPIEVKQLVVRGAVHRGPEPNQQDESPPVDLDAFKEELLEACRRMVDDVLQQRRER